MNMEHRWNTTDRGTDVMGEIPCHLATLFTTVLTTTDLAFNPVPQIIRLCRGTADSEGKGGIHSVTYKDSVFTA